MEKHRWQEIESLFHRVVDLAAEDRRALYGDEQIPRELWEEVEALIAADPKTEDRQLQRIQAEVGRLGHEELEPGRVGDRIGSYELVRELGRGGQGVVYLARRLDGDLRGQVAIKILQAGQRARYLHERFRQERHMLSGLEHPNIARFLDAGTTPGGRLFLVMEAVEGEPIDRYCESHDLGLEARLDLFCLAAGAVQAAHRQLIIHRDLKAGNILVTEDGTPKLLDFGIAKWLSAKSSLAETAPGMNHLTPQAASPEQVMGSPLTTATDVYSLGLLLYRMLTRRSAYVFKGHSPSEIERVVCHEQPPRPSHAAGRSELRGDLDAIILQALRKRPEERYASVEAMVEDIRRYQRREPIRARPAGFLYRAGKFARRHRRPLLTLLFLGLASVYVAVELRRERDRAVANEEMLLGIFSQAGQLGTDTILDQMAAYLPSLDDRPELKAQFMSTLGPIYRSLDNHREARAMLEGALEIRRQLESDQAQGIAVDLLRLGIVDLETGRHEEAKARFETARASAMLPGGEATWLAAVCLARAGEAEYELGHFDLAMERVRAALRIFKRLLGEEAPRPRQARDVANAFDTLAGLYYQRRQYGEAEAIYRETLPMLQEALGPDHLEVGTLWNNLGMVLRRQKRFEEAVAAFHEALRIDGRALESGSLRLGIRLMNLGNTHRLRGHPELALESCQEALRITTQRGGPGHANIPRIERCVERARKAMEAAGVEGAGSH